MRFCLALRQPPKKPRMGLTTTPIIIHRIEVDPIARSAKRTQRNDAKVPLVSSSCLAMRAAIYPPNTVNPPPMIQFRIEITGSFFRASVSSAP